MAATVLSGENSTMVQPEAEALSNDTIEPEPMYLAKLWEMALDQSLTAKERIAFEAEYFNEYTNWKTIQARLATAITNLAESEFWNSVCRALHNHWFCGESGPLQKVEEVVCLCLGHLESHATVYQLSLLLLLLEKLGIHHEKCFIFDPCHSPREIDILKHLGFTVLQENTEARIRVRQMTLFYMPHGDYQLTNNLIGANHTSLHLIAVLGNPFAWTCESEAGKRLDIDQSISRAPFVQKVLELVKETEIHDTVASKLRLRFANLVPRASQALGNGICDFLDCTLTTFPPTMSWASLQRPSKFTRLTSAL